MSLKVHDAYEYAGELPQLVSYLRRLRGRCLKAAAAHLADRAAVQLKETSFHAVYQQMREGLTGLSHISVGCAGNMRLVDNPRASVVVYPYGRRLFVQFFGLSSGFGRFRLRLPPSFRDYHYQNQSGRPRGVTAQKWRDRARLWAAVFGQSHTPSEAGLTYPIVEHEDAMTLLRMAFDILNKGAES